MNQDRKKFGNFFKVKHGYAFKSEFFSDSGNYVVVTPGNFFDEGGFKKKGDKEKFYTGPVPQDYVLKKGDLVIAMTEQAEGLLGSSALIPEGGYYLHNQRLGLIADLDEAKLNKKFLYYLFNSRDVRNQIRATATGAKVRHTAPERILSVHFKHLSIKEQRRIAATLSAYDDLIENNSRRIQILEEMARQIYEEWFVRFRFPGHASVKMVESELGSIPDGWKVKKLDDVAEEIIDYRGKTPKKLGSDWVDAGITAISALNIKNGELIKLESAKLVSEDLYKKWMKSELKQGDTLMTSEAPLGEFYYLTESKRLCLSQRVFSIRPNPSIILPPMFYLGLSNGISKGQIHSRASGTTVLGIRQSALREVLLLIPPMKLQLKTRDLLDDLLSLKDTLSKKISNLRTTRNLLLPKLISGEIDVSNFPEPVSDRL